jgi:tripartite-type tricarboxylate transporter receptor subunit TctC
MIPIRFATAFAALVAATAPAVLSAQDYPARTIRILTAQAGGGNDFVARLIAPVMSENVKQAGLRVE